MGCTFTVNETNVDRLKYPEIRLMNQGCVGVDSTAFFATCYARPPLPLSTSSSANGYWASAADPSSPAFLDEFSATCYYTAFNAKARLRGGERRALLVEPARYTPP